MRNQYKVLAEKYEQVLEADQEPVMTIDKKGTKEWKLKGKLHRLDGPAFVSVRGKEWYRNGKLHRVDGPALELADGTKEWLQNGELHRLDGPAHIDRSRSTWWVNNERHRLDGPAVEFTDGTKEWWIKGENYSFKDFNLQVSIMKGLKDLALMRTKYEKPIQNFS